MAPMTAASSLEDVCFAVCTALHIAGTVAELTGGSAATYYAPAAYQSGDADFIIKFSIDATSAADAIRNLGYRETGGSYFHHENLFTLEFPPGPLAIGDDLVARGGPVDMRKIERWSVEEEKAARFAEFGDALEPRGR
jgi:hypothetical protein